MVNVEWFIEFAKTPLPANDLFTSCLFTCNFYSGKCHSAWNFLLINFWLFLNQLGATISQLSVPVVWVSSCINDMEYTDSCHWHWQLLSAHKQSQNGIKFPHKIKAVICDTIEAVQGCIVWLTAYDGTWMTQLNYCMKAFSIHKYQNYRFKKTHVASNIALALNWKL